MSNYKMKNKMKKTGYVLFLICFLCSILYLVGLIKHPDTFDMIKFWVSNSFIMIFGHTAKTIVGSVTSKKERVDE